MRGFKVCFQSFSLYRYDVRNVIASGANFVRSDLGGRGIYNC
jgi:hypothetical protein